MIAKWLLVTIGTISMVGLAGCEDRDELARDVEPPTAGDRVERETSEALEATAEYLREQKDRFVARAEDELERLEERFEKVKDETTAEDARDSERLAELRVEVGEKLARAREELANLRRAGIETWDEYADDFRGTMDDLRESYNDLVRSYRAAEGRADLARG